MYKRQLLSRAAKDAGLDGLDPVLEGTTALAVSPEDHVAAAKILAKFVEDNGKQIKEFKIKAGFVEGKVLNKAEVEDLSLIHISWQSVPELLSSMPLLITFL